jgi:PPP family 3-phenylpropionic acid transporter
MRIPVLLSVYWFFLMGALGIFFPYYSLYLSETLGLNAARTGIVMGVMPLVGMFTQPAWGQLADRTGSRTTVLAILSLGTAAGFVALTFTDSFLGIVAGTAIMAVFMVSTVPMFVAVSMALLGENASRRFGYYRVWGTVGYLAAVSLFPLLLERLRSDGTAGLEIMLPVTAALYGVVGLLSLVLPRDRAVTVKAARGDWRILLRHKPFVRFLIFLFGVYLVQQGPMALFPLFVRELGGSAEMLSRMWIIMILLEIPLIPLAGWALSRIGARGLLAVGVFSGGVRWLATGLATDLNMIYAAQILHGITVTGIIIGAPLYVELVVPQRLRSTGQALVSTVGISFGGILSNMGTGWLMDAFDARTPAIVGGVAAIALTLALPWLVPKTEPVEATETDHLPPTDTAAMP